MVKRLNTEKGGKLKWQGGRVKNEDRRKMWKNESTMVKMVHRKKGGRFREAGGRRKKKEECGKGEVEGRVYRDVEECKK